MDRDSVFTDWKTQHTKMSILPQMIYCIDLTHFLLKPQQKFL